MALPPDLPDHLCTKRKFAHELGTTHQNVAIAIKTGKIKPNAIEIFKDKKYINRELARKQWAANWTGQGNSNALLAARLRSSSSEDMPNDDVARTAIERAKDASAVYDAKLKEHKYKKEAGLVVDKAEVNQALFELARELRDKLQAFPNRLVPYIRAAASDHEGKKILGDAIHELLSDMSNLENRLNQKTDGIS